MNKKQRMMLLIFLFAGLVIRLYVAFADRTPLIKDSKQFDYMAVEVVKGEGMRNELGELSAFRPPLYVYFMALCYRLFGHEILPIRIIQAFISFFTIGFIGFIAFKIFGSETCCWAVFIAALYPPFYAFYFSSSSIGNETLYTFLLTAAIAGMISYFLKPSWWIAIFSGFFWGISILCRVEPVHLLMVLPIALFLLGYQKRNIGYYFIFVFGMVGIILAPWTIRNYLVFRSFVPVVTAGGYAFYSSNHHGSDGFGTDFYGKIILPEDKTLKDAGVSEAMRDKIFFQKGLDFIKTYPREAAWLFIRKVYFYLDVTDTKYFKDGTRKKRSLNLGYILVALGAFLCVVLGIRESRHRKWIFLMLFIFILFILTHAIVLSSHRYRLPTEPLLIIMASYALTVIRKKCENLLSPKVCCSHSFKI